MILLEKLYLGSKVLQWLYKKSFLAKPLHKISQFYYYLYFGFHKRRQFKEQTKRLHGFVDSRYLSLRDLKGIYKGKRCFITCTGPSLSIEDLESLRNEYVFSMNSICLIHDMTNWKPDFYAIQDENVFGKVKNTLLATDNGQIFAPYDFFELYNTPKDWVYFHCSWAYHLYDRKFRNIFYSLFSDNCYATVYDGFSVTYSIMQLAVYMGFDELYLLGADCSYLGQRQHFIEHGHMTTMKDALTATDRLLSSYSEAKKYADNHGVKIYNATRGGCLEIFQRVKLEDVIAVNKKNKLV